MICRKNCSITHCLLILDDCLEEKKIDHSHTVGHEMRYDEAVQQENGSVYSHSVSHLNGM